MPGCLGMDHFSAASNVRADTRRDLDWEESRAGTMTVDALPALLVR